MHAYRTTLISGMAFMLLMAMAGCQGCGPAGQPAGDTAPATIAAAVTATAPAAVYVDPLAGDAGEALAARTAIACGTDDAREVVLPDGTIVEMDENTDLSVDSAARSGGVWQIMLELKRGAIRLEVPPAAGTQLQVRTVVATAGVRGTEFAVSHSDADGTAVDVFAGSVVTHAAGQEKTLQRNEAAVMTRTELRAGQIREETRQRWADARARLADKLIKRFNLDIEGEGTPNLDEVLRRIPETVRERARERMQERIAARRLALRAALRDVADTLDRQAMTAQERFEAARLNRIHMDNQRREEFRERVGEGQQRWQRGLEQLADTMARRGNADAAARLREAARRSAADRQRLNDTLAATGRVVPEFTVTVGPAEGAGAVRGERRLLARPAPSLPGNHPLVSRQHTLCYRVKIGPGGAVQDVAFVSATVARAESDAVGRLLRTWRFNVDFERQP